MMHKTVAMIFAGGRVEDLSVLTERRAKAAVVIGGAYRAIDFALTNLADAGIGRVGILAQYRPSSLIDHVTDGRPWNLVGTDRGVRFLPPYLGPGASDWYRGPGDALYQNIDFIERSEAEDVLLVSGDHIYRMDYAPLLRFHHQSAADLTMAFTPREDAAGRFGIGELNAAGQIVNFIEKPAYPRTNLSSMSVYVFRRTVLIDELKRAAAGEREARTYELHEILRRMIPRHRAYGYIYRGDWYYTRTLDEYFALHQLLLGAAPHIDLGKWHVRSNHMTRRRAPEPPVRILPSAKVENSIVSPGCVVGGVVRDSVLSPGVIIEAGAEVFHSILWDDVVVRAGSRLDCVISDKRTVFGPDAIVGFGPIVSNRVMPRSLTCGATVVGMDVQLGGGIQVGRGVIIAPGMTGDDLSAEIPPGEYVALKSTC